MRNRAAVFDLDDTLLLSEEAHRIAWEMACRDLGIPIEVDFSSLIGKTTEQVAEILGTSKKDELLRLKQHYYMRIAPGMVSPSPCVRELISQLEAKGYKIAVVLPPQDPRLSSHLVL